MPNKDYEALGVAVRQRRDELGLSQAKASAESKRIDVEHLDGNTRRSPGIGTTTWRHIEHAVPKNHHGYTLELLDWVLRWPAGTAMAILHRKPPPEGEPLSPEDGNGKGTPDEAALRAQMLRDRNEIDGLWTQVAGLTARLEGVEETLRQVLDAVEGD